MFALKIAVGVSELSLRLLRLIDRPYTPMPFLSVPKMTVLLTKEVGFAINHKRVERLMPLMGLQATRPERRRRKERSLLTKGEECVMFAH